MHFTHSIWHKKTSIVLIPHWSMLSLRAGILCSFIFGFPQKLSSWAGHPQMCEKKTVQMRKANKGQNSVFLTQLSSTHRRWFSSMINQIFFTSSCKNDGDLCSGDSQGCWSIPVTKELLNLQLRFTTFTEGFLFALMLLRANKAWKHGLRIDQVFIRTITVS